MNILIISGHGGTPYDPGAQGNAQSEAVLTRELGLMVNSELKKIKGVTPVLYDQRNDAYKILKNGGSLPLNGINYVLEIHFNSASGDTKGDGQTTGTEVLVHSTENGITVETAICERIAAIGFKNRGVRRREDLLVMNVVRKNYGISHALVEICFIDDPDDVKLYLSSKRKVASAIAHGIAEGFGLSYEGGGDDKLSEKGEDDMTEIEVRKIVNTAFEAMYDKANPHYTSMEQIPEYWRKEVDRLVKIGAIEGSGERKIDIRHDALQAAVIAFRVAEGESV